MICCCGEALIDMILTPIDNGKNGFVPFSGGAIFNTAIALGRLGVQTRMLTGISNDLFGQQLIASLHASNVNTSLAVYSNAPTTLAFVRLINGQANYTFYDENTAGRTLKSDSIPKLPNDIKCLYFGGISLCSEPSGDTYLELAKKEAGDHVIMIDPNIRTNFIEDIPRYRERLNAFFSIADIVKVSDEDLNWIIPESKTLAEKITVLKKFGPSVVILTRGRKGSMAVLKDGTEVSVPAIKVKIVDTVGAGDTFNAGVLAKLSEFNLLVKKEISLLGIDEMKKALSYGTKVAAVTVSRSGANPPWLCDLV